LKIIQRPLYLDAATFCTLLKLQGPSLALWRAAEIAALRKVVYEHPILDLGCGDGIVTSQVLSDVEIGLDPNERALSFASNHGIYKQLMPVPAEQAQLADESIATIVSNSVLEHLPNIDTVLAAASRLLRHGGRLVFTAPTEAFSNWLALPSHRYASWRNQQLQHLNLWSIEAWQVHLERCGLQIEEVRPYLHSNYVRLWDMLELLQQPRFGRYRLASLLWQRIPSTSFVRLAQWASHLDLSASTPGGGRLIIARKVYTPSSRL
jgi:SAM-dependent methyltransferase